jgi:hypothetical protein
MNPYNVSEDQDLKLVDRIFDAALTGTDGELAARRDVLWTAVDLSDRMPIVDDREPTVAVDAEVTREQERAAKAEVEAFKKSIYGDKV